MRYLCMSFCSWICSSVVSFFLFVFLVSNTFVSLFLLLFALSITSLKKSLWNCCESEKHFFVYLPFCWALVSQLFVFACLSLFRNFTFLIYSNLFLNICLFCSRSWMFLPLLLPFYVSLFWDSVWFDHRFSHLFYFLLLHIFFTQRHVFVLFPFVQSLFFFKKKICVSCLLALSKVSTCPLCFLLLFSLLNLLLLNASFFFFKTKTLSEKLHVFLFIGLFSVFLSSVFRVVFWLFSYWSPSQHVSF